jgi:hypothetical protein
MQQSPGRSPGMRRVKPSSPEGAAHDLSVLFISNPRFVYNDQGASPGLDRKGPQSTGGATEKGFWPRSFAPARAKMYAISYPGACAPGYYLPAPPGHCCINAPSQAKLHFPGHCCINAPSQAKLHFPGHCRINAPSQAKPYSRGAKSGCRWLPPPGSRSRCTRGTRSS